MQDKKKPIELNAEQVQALLERIGSRCLEESDYETLKRMIQVLLELRQAVEQKAITVKRLLKLLFGSPTERGRDLFGPTEPVKAAKHEKRETKRKGHGRKGVEAYPAAKKIPVALRDLRAGDRCPECQKGKVYKSVQPGVLLRLFASAPVEAKVYELEKLRCNLCGEIFTAETPAEAGQNKYDETVGSMVAVLKYGYGFPFHRIEKLQESLGIPLAASTQYEIVQGAAGKLDPAYEELVRQAAQGEILHNDDTTMKILALMNLHEPEKEEEEEEDGEPEPTAPTRNGSFTTGVLSVQEDRKIALFFTGRKHAGENLADLLQQREAEREPPIQMCDALSRNLPKSFQTVLANCMSHARRHFVDVAASFPEEVRHVIETLGKVYRNDEIAQERNLSAAERLAFHQAESGPLMEGLRQWLSEQLEQKKVEPNSGLGKAIVYMQRHWEALILFLKVESAPLHNNLCEQVLKRAVLHRKNALFFKTERGARVGDLFMSLIHTCNLAGTNPFEYLTALQLHAAEVPANPQLWMPWNYTERLSPDTS